MPASNRSTNLDDTYVDEYGWEISRSTGRPVISSGGRPWYEYEQRWECDGEEASEPSWFTSARAGQAYTPPDWALELEERGMEVLPPDAPRVPRSHGSSSRSHRGAAAYDLSSLEAELTRISPEESRRLFPAGSRSSRSTRHGGHSSSRHDHVHSSSRPRHEVSPVRSSRSSRRNHYPSDDDSDDETMRMPSRRDRGHTRSPTSSYSSSSRAGSSRYASSNYGESSSSRSRRRDYDDSEDEYPRGGGSSRYSSREYGSSSGSSSRRHQGRSAYY
ncbi:MAG: hypothetical protein Q9227_000669 [Pyrenula ochraceoflavens]